MQLPYSKPASVSSVVLLETDQSLKYQTAQVWAVILKKITALKPRAIILPYKPHTWSAIDVQNIVEKYQLIIGGSLTDDPVFLNSTEFSTGLTLLPPIDSNGYRQQWLIHKLHEKVHKSLELVVAEQLSGFEFDLQQDRFYIDFRGVRDHIPVIEMARVQRGELVESLIKDNVILIGFTGEFAPDLSTPIGSIPFSLYQAHALDTLLNAQEIDHLGLAAMMIISLCIVIGLLLLVPRISDQYQLYSLVVFLFFTLIIAWLQMYLFDIWVNPGVLLITETIVFLALYYERYKQHSIQLKKMALKSATSVEHRWLPKNFYASEEHWTQITNMVSQTLSLTRTIFLESVKNDHRLKEIKALNCSLEDIHEMRRDYQRKPYTIAIEQGGVVRLDREYLVNLAEDEIQYLVPLSFAGEVLGFWALTLTEDEQFDETRVLYAIQQFSFQISEMLFHREQWVKHQRYQKKPWVKLLSMQFDEPAYTSVNHAITFMSQRLIVMESVMDGMETSAVLYDLFGRVIQVNESMSTILSELNLAPYSITVADLISELSSCDLKDARDYLSYVILDKGTINLPVNHKNIKKGLMLSVRGLSNKDDNISDEDVSPFAIIGILCELIDMSHISEIYSQKEKVIEHLSGWLRNDLSSISIACDLVKDERIGEDKKTNLLEMIKTKVTSLGKSVERVNSIMQSDFVALISAHFPVDCHTPLLEVIKDMHNSQQKKVQYETEFPFYLPLVLASPKELKKIFVSILTLLYSDVIDNGKINIKIFNQNNMLEFSFSNEGFGIPDEHLQAYLNNENILESDEFKILRTIKHQVIDWGGNFEASSAVGEGMRFTFKLQAFYAHE